MATKHRADANKQSPSEYKAKLHPGAKPGEWLGTYVPLASGATTGY